MTLLLIGMIAAYLILERRNKLDKIEKLISEGTELTLAAVGGVYIVKVFKNDEELIKYTIERMHEAKESVDDLTWRSRDLITKTPATNKLYDKYLATKEEITTQNDRFTYREITTIRSLDALDRIETLVKKNIFNFHIKYYPAPSPEAPPPITFVLIDGSVKHFV